MGADGSINIDTKIDSTAFGKLGSIASTGFKALGVAITAVSTAIGALGSSAVRYNATMEQYATSFEVMTGSGEKAAQIMQELKDIGASTPFEVKGLAETTQLLMNYGFTSDDAIKKMQMLGDISQGSAEKMNRIATAYGQMSSAGKVMLEDVKQMIEAGFNPLQEISQSTGESMESLYSRISKGTLSVDEITASMERSTAAGGKYFQSMEKQSQTVAGLWSTLKDNFSQLTGEIYGGLSEGLRKTILPLAIGYIDELSKAFKEKGVVGLMEAIGDVLSKVITMIVSAAPKIVDSAISIIQSLIEGLSNNAFDIGKVGAQIVGSLIIGILACLPDLVNGAQQLFIGLIVGLTQVLPSLMIAVVTCINDLINTVLSNTSVMLGAAIQFFWALIDGIKTVLPLILAFLPEWIDSIIKFIVSAVPTLLNAAIELFKALLLALPPVLKALLKMIPTMIIDIVGAITSMIPVIIDAVIEIFNAIIEALPDILQGIVEALPVIILSIVTALMELLPVILQAVIDIVLAIINALPEIISMVVAVLPQLITGILNGLMAFLPQMIQAGMQLFVALITALPQIILTIIAIIPQIIAGILTALIESLPLLIQAGIDLFCALIEALPQIILAIVAAIPQIIAALIETIINNLGLIIQAGIDLFLALIDNLPLIISELIKAIPKIISALLNAITEGIPKMADMGLNLIKGLWQGISDAASWLWEKMKGFFRDLTQRIKDFFGIKSPSKMFRDMIGENLALGIGVGFTDNYSDVVKDMQDSINAEQNKLAKMTAGSYVISGEVTNKSINSLVTGNTFIVREEADIDKIANKLYEKQVKESR